MKMNFFHDQENPVTLEFKYGSGGVFLHLNDILGAYIGPDASPDAVLNQEFILDAVPVGIFRQWWLVDVFKVLDENTIELWLTRDQKWITLYRMKGRTWKTQKQIEKGRTPDKRKIR